MQIFLFTTKENLFGTRVEVKNLNSFKAVARAIDYEVNRQIETIEKGGKIDQETRLWDDDVQVTRVMRSKEEAMDYRYFHEPDLLTLVITDDEIEAIKETMPESITDKVARFINDYGIPEYDANILCEDIELADYFENTAKASGNPKSSSNWIMTEVLKELKQKNTEIKDFVISSEDLGKIIKLIDTNVISSKIAKTLFEMKLTDERDPETIVKEEKMAQVTDDSAIETLVDEVLANNPKLIEDYKNSDEGRKPRVLKGLIGQAMKLSKGKANPQMVTELMIKKFQNLNILRVAVNFAITLLFLFLDLIYFLSYNIYYDTIRRNYMILLVEDTLNMRKLITTILKSENIEVDEAADGEEALEKLENGNKYSLLLVDIMMPKLNGLELTREIRKFSQVPIIFITALSDEKSQILAYDAGADGYITKPFPKQLLLSIVNRYLKKTKLNKKFEGLEIEEKGKRILIDGEECDFPPKEREILMYLIENENIVVTREQIITSIWGYSFIGNDRVIDNHIKKLRQRLKNYSKFIKTVKLVGYKFEVNES